MILCTVATFSRYQSLNPRFARLGEYLQQENLQALPQGRHDIAGDALYVISSPQAATRGSAMLEAHRRYIDVHVVLDGIEGMGWAALANLREEDKPFDVENDYVCFREPPTTIQQLTTGQLAIFFPEDAHVPLLGDGSVVKKCVFKVRCDDI
jgi:YhcH/YjgK/YiaL family protein